MQETVLVLTSVSLILVPAMLLAMQRSVRDWENKFRDPFSAGLLRPAGTKCLEDARERFGDVMALCGLMSGMIPALAMAVFISQSYLVALCLLTMALGLTVMGCWRLRHHMTRARTARMGYLGELAVAEALMDLPVEEGWRVFHDVRFTTGKKSVFNVDHVVVGPSGVYALETKAVSPVRKRMRGDHEFKVNGDVIEFPDGRTMPRAIKQARKNAKFVHHWIHEQTSIEHFVTGYVVLPGWSAKCSCGERNTRICSAMNLVGFLRKEAGTLEPRDREAVIALLDSHCRDLSFERSDNFLSAHHRQARVPSEPISVELSR